MKIQGLINAPFTGFHQDGSLNLDIVPAYADLLHRNGVSGVFINGSSGEGNLMTSEERMLNAEKWVESSPEGFKVIVHVGTNSVRESQKLAKHAQKIGAWATSIMAPTWPKPARVEELCQFAAEIASATPDLPFYFYHIPALSGVFLPMLPFLKLAEEQIPNFAGLKYTFESLYEYNQCRLYKDGKFDILHGQDETLLASLAQGGAQGCIGGTFNYAAGLYVNVRKCWEAGDIEGARNYQNIAQDLINVICKYRGNIVGGKQIMKLIGLDLGPNRTPFQNLSDEEFASMKQDLEAINFQDFCNK